MVLELYQKLDEKKETIKNKRKKIKNLTIWLFVWYANSPPSVEYIAKQLIIPSNRIETIRIISKEKTLSLKVKWDTIAPGLNIIHFHPWFVELLLMSVFLIIF